MSGFKIKPEQQNGSGMLTPETRIEIRAILQDVGPLFDAAMLAANKSCSNPAIDPAKTPEARALGEALKESTGTRVARDNAVSKESGTYMPSPLHAVAPKAQKAIMESVTDVVCPSTPKATQVETNGRDATRAGR
jgi:hypothetical protein